MASDARFIGGEHRDATLAAALAPRAQPAVDNLRAARGILSGALLGAGAWAIIVLAVWLIAR